MAGLDSPNSELEVSFLDRKNGRNGLHLSKNRQMWCNRVTGTKLAAQSVMFKNHSTLKRHDREIATVKCIKQPSLDAVDQLARYKEVVGEEIPISDCAEQSYVARTEADLPPFVVSPPVTP
jgi:hypothetical protein